MDELDRLYRRLVHNVRAGFPELMTRPFEVSQLYQQIVPYRTNRRELGFDSNEEYELSLMQLLAGLRGYLTVDRELQGAMRQELASPNPDLRAFRVFATATVSLAAEPLRALERQSPARDATVGIPSPSSLAPAEQVVMAARATEEVSVTGEQPAPPALEAPVAPPRAAATRDASRPAPLGARPPGPSASSSAGPPSAPASPPAGSAPSPSVASPSPRPVPRTTPLEPAAGDSCRYCSCTLPEGRRVTFCPGCGHNLTVQHCPACATELEVGWKFCITCGREVAARVDAAR